MPPTDQVVESTLHILRILREHNTKATFFILGPIAENFPELIIQLAKEGHEIATHGYSHRFVNSLTPTEFADELSKSLTLLRDISGQPVVGHRAPAFSLDHSCSWAYELMVEHQIKYDSSIVPEIDRSSAQTNNPLLPYPIMPNLIEVPLSVIHVGHKRVLLGGSYFRLSPYYLSKKAIQTLNRRNTPASLYMHPYEFDSYKFDTSPVTFDYRGVPLKTRLLTKVAKFQRKLNRVNSEHKLSALLKEFRFTSVQEVLNQLGMNTA